MLDRKKERKRKKGTLDPYLTITDYPSSVFPHLQFSQPSEEPDLTRIESTHAPLHPHLTAILQHLERERPTEPARIVSRVARSGLARQGGRAVVADPCRQRRRVTRAASGEGDVGVALESEVLVAVGEGAAGAVVADDGVVEADVLVGEVGEPGDVDASAILRWC